MQYKKHSLVSFLQTILCLALNAGVIFFYIAYINDVLKGGIKIYYFDYIMLSLYWPVIITGLIVVLTFITLMFGMLQDVTYLNYPAKSDAFGANHRRLSIVSALLTVISIGCSYGFMFYHRIYQEQVRRGLTEQLLTAEQEWTGVQNSGFINGKISAWLLVVIFILFIAFIGISIANWRLSAKMRRGVQS